MRPTDALLALVVHPLVAATVYGGVRFFGASAVSIPLAAAALVAAALLAWRHHSRERALASLAVRAQATALLVALCVAEAVIAQRLWSPMRDPVLLTSVACAGTAIITDLVFRSVHKQQRRAMASADASAAASSRPPSRTARRPTKRRPTKHRR